MLSLDLPLFFILAAFVALVLFGAGVWRKNLAAIISSMALAATSTSFAVISFVLA